MKVLLAMYRDDPGAGGSLRVGQALAKGLRTQGVDARICFSYGQEGPIGQSAVAPCYYLNLNSSKDLFRWPRVRALVHDFKPDVIHFIDPLVWMHLALTGIDLKRVSHVHGAILRKNIPLKTNLEWRFIKSKDHTIVCITEGARQSTLQRFHISKDRTSVVYNGIDFNWFQNRPYKDEARHRLGIPHDKLILGAVGRLFEARGYDDMLRIVSQLDPRWGALIVGSGPERESLELLVKRLGVADRTYFTGPLADVRLAYSAMDAYAFLPLYDSFGLATAEAMACRVPVFGLDCPGEYREQENPLVTNDNAIFLKRRWRRFFSDKEDPTALQSLAQRIQWHGANPAALEKMTARAWEHVRVHFSIETQVNRMHELYQGLLHDRHGRVGPLDREQVTTL